ncbi:MAG: DUF998 domain-containing protein [Anaerolineales bacterium]|nr:DUF998 domain-containing protein [Anaerolineales bacterium]
MVKTILTPAAGSSSHASTIAVVLVLVFSFGSLLAAPLLMPDSYHWIEHTTSHSAAQGVEGAWLARLGFLLLGLAVIWLAAIRKANWPRAAVWMHAAFGVFMVATAAFSVRPWIEGLPFDPIEDALHSFTATAMGFAFAFGVLARWLRRQREDRLSRLLDIVALAASVGIPLIMVYQADIGGLVQRLMFLIAYIWYGRESIVKEDN